MNQKGNTNPDRIAKVPLTTLAGSKLTLTPDGGVPLRKVREFFSACFNENTNVTELSTKLKEIYSPIKENHPDYELPDFVNEPVLQKKYDVWKAAYSSKGSDLKAKVFYGEKALQEDLTDVSYVRPNFNFSSLYSTAADHRFYLRQVPCVGLKNETIEDRLYRCTNLPKNLECSIKIGCQSSGPAVDKTEPEDNKEYETQTVPCDLGKEGFDSNRSVLKADSRSKINDCLQKIVNVVAAGKTVANINADIECCSTTVKIASGLSNADLTDSRFAVVGKYIQDQVAANSTLAGQTVTINDPITDNQNLYYNPTSGILEETGTCGPLTNKPDTYETWAQYADQTKAYLKQDKIKGKTNPFKEKADEWLKSGTNFTWIWKDKVVIPKEQETQPDLVPGMADWRFNKITIYYDIVTEKPVTEKPTTTPTNTTTVEPGKSILCLRLDQTEGVKSVSSSGSSGTPKKKHAALKIHIKGKSYVNCPEF